MSGVITTQSSLQCPHGGVVQIISSDLRATAGGASIATSADTFIVSGCLFQLPTTPPTPHPCVTVQWLVPEPRVKANGSQSLNQSSIGICLAADQAPQGPVAIVRADARVASQ